MCQGHIPGTFRNSRAFEDRPGVPFPAPSPPAFLFGLLKKLPIPMSYHSGWQMGKLSHQARKGAWGMVVWSDLQEGAQHIQFSLALQWGIPHELHHSCRKDLP
jgi:hypothetical protein